MYQHPGVYIEHVASNALAIEAASTAVTAFIGFTGRGTRIKANPASNAPEKFVGAPVFVSSLSQYAAQFGPVGGGSGGIRNAGASADAMGHAVNTFFANGGSRAYIVPVASSDGTAASATVAFETGSGAEAQQHQLEVTAASPGAWADTLLVRVEEGRLDGEVTLVIGIQDAESLAETDAADKEIDVELERITGLTLDSDSGGFIETRMGQVSSLVRVSLSSGGTGGALPQQAQISGGADPGQPTQLTHFSAALEQLQDYRDVSIIVLPGTVFQSGQDGATVYGAVISHCETMKNRMVIVDPAPGIVLNSPKDVTDAGFPTSPYAALYHPQLTVSNPYYDAETAANLPATFRIGPAAAAAGIWGRIDATRGVWKAPAGLEATVRGTLGPVLTIGEAAQDNLNEFGVNCLRAIIGPTVVWGARTLATKARPQYRYIPVRRTQNMIGESLFRALQAVVFEPNDHKLWASLRASVGAFMDGLHRAGAFQGEKASDAFFVRCGLGTTMTQGDIDAGIVRVAVGFAPLKPAEFVVVEIQQKVGQTA